MLALEEQRSRGGYENTINSKDPNVTDSDRQRAKDRLAELPRDTQQQRDIINTQNAHPLDAYRQRLHQATDSTKDALQQVEVNALGRLEDQIAGTIGKVLGLKGAFGELASSIISDLARIKIERAILGATGGSGGGGKGLVGLLSSIFGGGGGDDAAGLAAVSSGADDFDYAGLTGFANGGTATIGGNPGVDQNVLSINGVPALRVGQGEQLTVTPQNRAIAPNNAAISPSTGGAGVVQHITIDQRGSVTPDAFRAGIISEAAGTAKSYATRAGIASVQAAPGAVKREQVLRG